MSLDHKAEAPTVISQLKRLSRAIAGRLAGYAMHSLAWPVTDSGTASLRTGIYSSAVLTSAISVLERPGVSSRKKRRRSLISFGPNLRSISSI